MVAPGGNIKAKAVPRGKRTVFCSISPEIPAQLVTSSWRCCLVPLTPRLSLGSLSDVPERLSQGREQLSFLVPRLPETEPRQRVGGWVAVQSQLGQDANGQRIQWGETRSTEPETFRVPTLGARGTERLREGKADASRRARAGRAKEPRVREDEDHTMATGLKCEVPGPAHRNFQNSGWSQAARRHRRSW